MNELTNEDNIYSNVDYLRKTYRDEACTLPSKKSMWIDVNTGFGKRRQLTEACRRVQKVHKLQHPTLLHVYWL